MGDTSSEPQSEPQCSSTPVGPSGDLQGQGLVTLRLKRTGCSVQCPLDGSVCKVPPRAVQAVSLPPRSVPERLTRSTQPLLRSGLFAES
jgi:hypothetical protein